jgi:hypothetical protein
LNERSAAELEWAVINCLRGWRVQPAPRASEIHAVSNLASRGLAWPSLYGVTMGEPTIPERIDHAGEPRLLPVVLSGGEAVHFLEGGFEHEGSRRADDGLSCRSSRF